MNKIIEKKYLKVKFMLDSPLIIGCGKSENTDNDLITDSAGYPYIPGTAIAGVIREALSETGLFNDSDIKEYLGFVEINREKSQKPAQNNNNPNNTKKDSENESRIIFYDANLTDECRANANVTIRDSVKLDEYKTAEKGAKFDMEVLEPGVIFETYIEMNNTGTDVDKEKNIWEAIKAIWKEGNITFGGKTTRGMGAIKTEGEDSIQEKDFDLSVPARLEEWIDFRMYDSSVSWNKPKFNSSAFTGNMHKIELELNLLGGISIRCYSTEKDAPDYSQLTVKSVNNTDETPVIPGTTWAGAFRRRMTSLLRLSGYGNEESRLIISLFFGNVEPGKKGDKRKSKITFSESRIEGGTWKTITRNAIDRFTGGSADGALYTEKTYYGGETSLVIKIKEVSDAEFDVFKNKYKAETGSEPAEKKDITNAFFKAFAAALADLHGGYLAIGGLTAVGRGLFTVKSVSGSDKEIKNPEIVYNMIVGQLIKDEEQEVISNG